MIITVLGKSVGTITMISDNLESKCDYGKIVVINNLGLKDELPYKNKLFQYEEHKDVHSELFLTGFIIGAYNPLVKKKILSFFEKYVKGDMFVNVVHKSAQISSNVELKTGILINALVSIAAEVKIGDHVSINRNASIGHHTELGNFVTISPAATICGNVRIGDETVIGAGAIINDGVTIGKNCIIGSGSLVTKDIPDNTKGFGLPFKEQPKA